jgi:PAS domain S-box-containing protein
MTPAAIISFAARAWPLAVLAIGLLLGARVALARRRRTPNWRATPEQASLALRDCARQDEERRRLASGAQLRKPAAPQARQLEAQQARQLEAQLEAVRRELKTVLGALPVVVNYWDRDQINRSAYGALQRWFGVDPARVPGMHLRDLLSPELYEFSRPRIEAALRGEPQEFERPIKQADGSVAGYSLINYQPDVVDGEVQGFYAMMHDISELRAEITARKRAEQALAESETRYRALVEDQSELVSLVTPDGRLTFVNSAYAKHFQCTPESMIGTSMYDYIAEQHHDLVRAHVRSACAGVTVEDVENEVVGRDGSTRWVAWTNRALRDSGGMVTSIHSVGRDITDRNRAERALRENQERLENILVGTDAGSWDWDIESGAIGVNDRWAGMLGYSVRHLTPLTIERRVELSHPDELAASRELLVRHLKGQTPFYDFEGRVRHRDGHWVWVLDRGRVSRRGPDGRALRMQGTMLDISNTKAAEQALRARERQMRLALDAFSGRLAHWDRDGRCTFASPAYRDLFHVPPEQMVGRTRRELFAGVGGDDDEARVGAALNGQPQSRERAMVGPDGRTRHFLVHYIPDREGDEARGVISAAIEVTQLKQVQEALELRTRQAEQASVAKGEFLANMSHELRTPLNAIIGVTHLLADSPLDPDQRSLVENARLAGRSLLGIVNDVLDLSKIEAGEMALDEVPFNPAELLHEVVAVFAPQAQIKGLTLVADPADVPSLVVGDAMRLRQILYNLTTNAIKFTERGEVRLQARQVERTDGRVSVRFSVCDTGIGIPPEVQRRLFAPFVQAETSTARRFGGSGLGLSIVRQLARLMGGETGVQSAPGEGSEFWVMVSLHEGNEDSLRGQLRPQPAAARLSVVAADDSAENRQALLSLARHLGWEAAAVESADALIESIENRIAQGLVLPDVLIVSARLGGGAGVAALRRLSERVGPPRLPAVLLVGADEDREASAQNARDVADRILTRPVQGPALFHAVSHAVARRQEPAGNRPGRVAVEAAAAGPAGGGALHGVHLLVVDDSDINLDIARRILERAGALVQCCSDGSAALSLLSSSHAQVDAVVMDVQMPGMDGLEVTRRLRSGLGLTRLPVIGLSAGALVEERRRALAAGMDQFLSKPLDPAELIRVLSNAVHGARGHPPPDHDSDAHPAERSAAAPPSDWPLIEGVEAGAAAVRFGNDAALYVSMLARLLREFNDLAGHGGELPAADAGREALAARAHKLAGSAGQLGADRVSRQASALESALRKGDPEAVLADAATALAQALQALIDAGAPALAAAAGGSATGASAGGGSVAGAAPASAAAPLTDADRDELLMLLTQRDLAALDRADALAASLQAALPAEDFARLRQSLEDLDFDAAAGALACARAS